MRSSPSERSRSSRAPALWRQQAPNGPPRLRDGGAFFDPALPSDALGFVPRTPVIKLAAPEWELMPAALAAVLIAIIVGGGLVTRSELARRRGAVAMLAVLLIFLVALFLSFELLRDALVLPMRISPEQWSLLAAVSAASVIAAGLLSARRFRIERGDVLFSACVFFLASLAVFRLSGMWPMFSIRLMGYAAPVLTLVALAPIATGAIARSSGAFRALRVAPLAVAAALLAIGSLTTATRASTSLRTADGAAAMASAAGRTAPRAALEVAVDDGWDQAWPRTTSEIARSRSRSRPSTSRDSRNGRSGRFDAAPRRLIESNRTRRHVSRRPAGCSSTGFPPTPSTPFSGF